MARPCSRTHQDPVEIKIDSLSYEGRGIGEFEGKKIVVDGALSGERVLARYTRKRSRLAEAYVTEIIEDSDKRIDPKCPYFSLCGGCSLQHLGPNDQIQHKQNALLEQLEYMGRVTPEDVIEPLTGTQWGYRRKARLGVKYVLKKESLLVGFREKSSSFIVEMDHCAILHESIGSMIQDLKRLIRDLEIFDKIPQLEVAAAENKTALVFRHLVPLNDHDINVFSRFQEKSGMSVFLQSGGPDSVVPLNANTETELLYTLDKHDLKIRFEPCDFTQVNFDINAQMVDRVLAVLGPESTDNILDLFCGLGNFSLPLARYAGRVTGVDMDPGLIKRANRNAEYNSIDNIRFISCDLITDDVDPTFLKEKYNKLLLDPPRTGAREIIEKLEYKNMSKMIYISCNPATLARDAGILVHNKGFRLVAAGVMDMFPHTSHVESMALFER